jgi:hypothetical protein
MPSVRQQSGRAHGPRALRHNECRGAQALLSVPSAAVVDVALEFAGRAIARRAKQVVNEQVVPAMQAKAAQAQAAQAEQQFMPVTVPQADSVVAQLR